MSMRRIFIIRKDLHLSAGKLAAMVGHCAEAYWTRMISKHLLKTSDYVFPCSTITSDGKRVPQYYRRADLCELSLKAFDEGKDTFFAKPNKKGVYEFCESIYSYKSTVPLNKDEVEEYIQGIFTKTICEAKNLNHLLKAVEIAKDLGLKENADYGLINDKCLTELVPENEDGTCTVGIWFKPLDDDVAHQISKKYQLYKD